MDKKTGESCDAVIPIGWIAISLSIITPHSLMPLWFDLSILAGRPGLNS